MAAGKITPETAQATLEGLSRVGEGWHLSVATAIAEGKHTALGMDRREFAAQAGGFKLLDPREAIIELHQQGMSRQAIADVLAVDADRTVSRTLYEEGLISTLPKRADPTRRAASGDDSSASTAARGDGVVDGTAEEDLDVEELRAQIEDLELELGGMRVARDREIKKLKDKIQSAAEDAHRKLQNARREWEANQSDEDRARLLKEAQAFADEQGEKVLAGFARLGAQSIVGNLDDATKHLKLLLREGGLTDTVVGQIERAHASFVEELRVAVASTGTR